MNKFFIYFSILLYMPCVVWSNDIDTSISVNVDFLLENLDNEDVADEFIENLPDEKNNEISKLNNKISEIGMADTPVGIRLAVGELKYVLKRDFVHGEALLRKLCTAVSTANNVDKSRDFLTRKLYLSFEGNQKLKILRAIEESLMPSFELEFDFYYNLIDSEMFENNEGDLGKAEVLLDKLITIYNDKPEIILWYYQRAYLFYRLGMYDRASTLTEKLRTERHENPYFIVIEKPIDMLEKNINIIKKERSGNSVNTSSNTIKGKFVLFSLATLSCFLAFWVVRSYFYK